jgi:hypothetical protein
MTIYSDTSDYEIATAFVAVGYSTAPRTLVEQYG